VSPPSTRLPHVVNAAVRMRKELGPVENSGSWEGPKKERRRVHSSVGLNPMNRQQVKYCATICCLLSRKAKKYFVDNHNLRRLLETNSHLSDAFSNVW